MTKFELLETKLMNDMPREGEKMLEGKFLIDEKVVYGTLCDFETPTLEEANIYIYTNPFEDLCNAEDYDVSDKFDDRTLAELKAAVLKKYHSGVAKCE